MQTFHKKESGFPWSNTTSCVMRLLTAKAINTALKMIASLFFLGLLIVAARNAGRLHEPLSSFLWRCLQLAASSRGSNIWGIVAPLIPGSLLLLRDAKSVGLAKAFSDRGGSAALLTFGVAALLWTGGVGWYVVQAPPQTFGAKELAFYSPETVVAIGNDPTFNPQGNVMPHPTPLASATWMNSEGDIVTCCQLLHGDIPAFAWAGALAPIYQGKRFSSAYQAIYVEAEAYAYDKRTGIAWMHVNGLFNPKRTSQRAIDRIAASQALHRCWSSCCLKLSQASTTS